MLSFVEIEDVGPVEGGQGAANSEGAKQDDLVHLYGTQRLRHPSWCSRRLLCQRRQSQGTSISDRYKGVLTTAAKAYIKKEWDIRSQIVFKRKASIVIITLHFSDLEQVFRSNTQYLKLRYGN